MFGRNDPCPCGSGKKYKHCHLGKPDDPARDQATSAIADYDQMADLPELLPYSGARVGALDWQDRLDDGEQRPLTPEQEAWLIVDRSYGEDPPEAWRAAAKAALKLYPACSGAYYLLSLSERRPDRQLEQLNNAITLAEREIGTDELRHWAERDWDEPHVEYAMLARNERAMLFISLDRADEAIAALQEMLDLDSADRLDALSKLLVLMLSIGRAEEALQLAQSTGDTGSGPTLRYYARALASFTVYGDTFFSRRALGEAMIVEWETYDILTLLLADEDPDDGFEDVESDHERPGGDDEEEISDLENSRSSLFTLIGLAGVWCETDGATDWLNAIREHGPRIMHDIPSDPAGPKLVIGVEFGSLTSCPACGGPMRTSPLSLVVAVEPDDRLVIAGKLRQCKKCQILAVGMDTLIEEVERHAGEATDLDYVPLGVLSPDTVAPGSMRRDAIESRMQRLSSLSREDDPPAWPTDESVREALEQFTASDQQGLLGPVTNSAPRGSGFR